MIRFTRMFFLEKNKWNIYLSSPNAAFLSKQIRKGFSLQASDVKCGESTSTPQKKEISDAVVNAFQDSFTVMKYSFLRQIFNGKTGGTRAQRDSDLKELLDNLPFLAPTDIIKILKLFAGSSNRPIECIKALCEFLASHDNWKYSPHNVADFLYSLGSLSYRHELAVEVITKDLKTHGDFGNCSSAVKILLSLGEIKYKDPELTEKLLKYILNNSPSTEQLLSCLKAVCFLNHLSPTLDDLIEPLAKLNEVDFVHSMDYINFVWGCLLLNKESCITSEHISRVLSVKFISRCLNYGLYLTAKWKLLNINTAAHQLSSYEGPFLDAYPQFKVLAMSIPKKTNAFVFSVQDCLSYIVPPNIQVRSLVNIESGFYLDIELVSNIQVETNESKNNKLGFLLLQYNDVCSDNSLTGLSAFKLKLLKGMGYKIIELRYSEYNPRDPLSNKISTISKKIHEVDKNILDSAESSRLDSM